MSYGIDYIIYLWY